MKLKKSLIILVVLFFFFVLLTASVYLYFLFNGKKILLDQIGKNLGVKAEASALRVVLPAWIIIDNFKIEDYLKVAKITVSPSFLGFLKGDIIFNSIIVERPQLKVTRKKDASLDFGIAVYKKGKFILLQKAVSPEKTKAPIQANISSAARHPLRQKVFYFDKLKVTGAAVEFIDMALPTETPFVTRLANCNIDASRVSLLQPLRMQFNGDGEFISEDSQRVGDFNTSGWIDLLTKDTDAKLQIDSLRLVYFGPYYKKYLKRDLKSGDMLLAVKATSSNNELTADCHIELTNIVFANPEEATATAETADVAAFAIGSMLTTEGKAIFDFSFKTKTDNPKLENIRLKGSFFKTRVEDMMSHPQETIEKMEKIGKDFKAIGKEFKKIFKGD